MISNLIVLTCATQAAPRIGGAAWSSAAVPAACSRAGLQQLPLAPRPRGAYKRVCRGVQHTHCFGYTPAIDMWPARPMNDPGFR